MPLPRPRGLTALERCPNCGNDLPEEPASMRWPRSPHSSSARTAARPLPSRSPARPTRRTRRAREATCRARTRLSAARRHLGHVRGRDDDGGAEGGAGRQAGREVRSSHERRSHRQRRGARGRRRAAPAARPLPAPDARPDRTCTSAATRRAAARAPCGSTGRRIKSCTFFAVQANGREITTVEGMMQNGALHPVQQGFKTEHGLQCGRTPGMMLVSAALLEENPT